MGVGQLLGGAPLYYPYAMYGCSAVAGSQTARRWKDHFKSDFRSDQDHLLEK
jgi:hypothetical protein